VGPTQTVLDLQSLLILQDRAFRISFLFRQGGESEVGLCQRGRMLGRLPIGLLGLLQISFAAEGVP